jgi:acetyltransferase
MRPVNVPPAYPKELETWAALSDGSEIFVRPVVPQDEARMVNAMEFGDGETIRRRFLSAAPPNHPNQIRYLVNLDYSWRFALLGMDGSGDSIGLARYEGSEGSEAAEVAIVVDPAWRRRGLASTLLLLLEPHAIATGISEFYAMYQPDNKPVADLLSTLGYGGAVLVDGLMRTSKTLR